MNWINLVVSGIVSSIVSAVSLINISQTKICSKNIIKFVILFFLLMLINIYYFDGVIRIIINISILIICLYFFFFKNIKMSVFYSFIYEIIVFFIEIILSLVFVLIFKFDLNCYESFSFSLLLFSILNSLILYILSKSKSIIKNISKLEKIVEKKNGNWIYISIVVVLLIFLVTFNRYNLNDSLSFYINISMILFILVTLIYVIYNNFQKEKLEDKYNQMMDYVSKYEKIINEQGKKNHEYNNQLMVLKGYINKPDKLNEYLDLIISEHKGGQNYTIKQLGYFPDGGVKGLIYHKLSKMDENEVKPYLYIDQNIKDIFEEKFGINTYRDITKLLGVFLDNAIEAAKDAEPKEVELEIKNKESYILITVTNTFSNNADVSQVGKKGFSTKGSGHGFGLSIVKDIAKNNSNIETFSDIINNKFKQTIMIYYKK